MATRWCMAPSARKRGTRARPVVAYPSRWTTLSGSVRPGRRRKRMFAVVQCQCRLLGGAPCAVRKVGYLGPVSPDGQGDRNHYFSPAHRTAPTLTQSKHSDKAVFHTENAGLLSTSAVFSPADVYFPGGGWFAGWSQEPNLLMGAAQKRQLPSNSR